MATRAYMRKRQIEEYRHKALDAAKDFRYPVVVTASIKVAASISEISAIMANARKKYL